MPMRAAILGQGRIGRALSDRLLGSGCEVSAWNRTPRVLPDRVEVHPTPAAAARGAEVVLLALADDVAVREVALGPEGLAGVVGPALLVDLSTVSPGTSRLLAARPRQERVLSAPVLGSPEMVRKGVASFLVGGTRACFEALAPLWDALGGRPFYCGEDPGGAAALKLAVNSLLLAEVAALSEAVALAGALGVGLEVVREVIGGAHVTSDAMRARLGPLVEDEHRGWFTAELAAKDGRLVLAAAREARLDLPIAERVWDRYEETVRRGHGKLDMTAIGKLLSRPAGSSQWDRPEGDYQS
jgi:3-hydroxyisobutyrate dehydrogenase-like beta-hydroxyacid dehydrogenase